MHISRLLHSAISILALLSRADATPLGPSSPEEGSLEERSCDNPCGYYSQLCCASGETCITDDNNQAVCSSSGGSSGSDSDSGSGSGQWEYYSSTWLVTDVDVQTKTSVWSSWIASPTSGSGSCRTDLGESECGDECCSASDICNENKKCVLAATTSIWATDTNTATPPVRPTDSNTVTETATATQGFETPVTTDGSPALGVDAPEDDGGLSGGAIAGIVVGTLAGVFLLFLLCLCLCARGLLNSILACLGCGRKRRREETYVEDHYSHHTHRPAGRTWFGTRPSGAHEGEKKSRWSSFATIGIVLGAIALCLGLRRKRDHDDEKSSTSYTYPSYYSYYTSTTKAQTDELDGVDDLDDPGPGYNN
ncbi:uncharacterized protein BDV17DRAFT_286741 [Aspergillus undulatus]|uniref:uncharacterized protein n=1 Tax=Aspergillus undulatus TaxID=1810928 RepID=UPI003CCD4670